MKIQNRYIFFIVVLVVTSSFQLLSCRKYLSVENGNGNIEDGNGNCYTAVVAGNYFYDKPVKRDSCFVTIKVDVIKTGDYKIRTDLQNGFYFADSGKFSSLGSTSLKLRIMGQPVKDTFTHFQYTFNGQTCGFDVVVTKSTNPLPVPNPDEWVKDTWEFQDSASGGWHRGGIINNIQSFDSVSGIYLLNAAVKTTVPYDSLLFIQVKFPNNKIEPGIFHSKDDRSFFKYMSNVNFRTFYLSDEFTPGTITFEVIEYDPLTKYLKMKFYGSAEDGFGAPMGVRKGRLYAKSY